MAIYGFNTTNYGLLCPKTGFADAPTVVYSAPGTLTTFDNSECLDVMAARNVCIPGEFRSIRFSFYIDITFCIHSTR